MAINYTWDVSTVDVKEIDSNSDTVFNVHWRLTGTDDVNNKSATIYGSQVLDTSDLSNFIAFTDLTTSKVESWVEAAIGADKITEMKLNLDGNIAELVTPTVQTKQVG
jgi:hypothetical protein|tara:strand:- start:129 stop:452 length:324 start_codon:yes stop_codon:yes gene_type:complete